MWQMAVLWLASMALTYLLAPKGEDTEPASKGDFDAPTADPSKPIPVIFGTVWVKDPNVVWYGDIKTKKIKSDGSKK